ncbi:hypothetical protein H0H81_005292, partial [Sphagnurus paluster]
LASGVGHEPSFWLGQAQSSSLIDRIREPSNRKDPEATAAFIKDLCFQKNNKRKTPEPEEDAISWGSDTEPARLGDTKMEDADTPALRLVTRTPIFALCSTSPTHKGTKATTRPDSDQPAATGANDTDTARETETKPEETTIARCRRGSTQESRPHRDTGR